MDTAQWPQDVGLVKPMENQMVSNASNPNMNSGGANNTAMLEQQRRARPHKEQAINCPRCNSTNTKFCYYNNYSLTQPRYFCKTCRRYWTEGGSLRNVPVGGGSRKNRRSSSSSSITSSVSVTKKLPDLTQPPMINMSSAKSVSHQNPKIHEGQDLNLAFSTSTDHHYHTMSEFAHELPNMDQSNNSNHIPTSSTTTTTHLSALEFLRNGINSKGYGSFMPMAPSSVQDTNTVYSSPSGGFTLQDYKPTTTLNFGVDGYGSIQQGVHHQENSGRPLFPFEDLRQVSNTSEFDHHQNNRGAQGDSNGYWSGMLGGGSW